MPRFTILEHDHPVLHWDLLLEAGDHLRAWRLSAPPQSGQTASAEASFPHRLMYLDYEGPVSGGRGRVTRWDAGMFALLTDESELVRVRLEGQRIRGVLVLTRTGEESWAVTLELVAAESPPQSEAAGGSSWDGS
jgi:hypothetical protein